MNRIEHFDLMKAIAIILVVIRQLVAPISSIGNPFVIHLMLTLAISALIIPICLLVETIISKNKYLNFLLFGKPLK